VLTHIGTTLNKLFSILLMGCYFSSGKLGRASLKTREGLDGKIIRDISSQYVIGQPEEENFAEKFFQQFPSLTGF
jgi:hypothetical protein